jgi:hypothetical protein
VDPGPISFTLLSPVCFSHTVYFLAYYYCFPLDTLIPLFTTNLGFITEGKLAAMLITPSLRVPNWPVIYIINTAPPTCFLAPLPGKKKTSARGVSHAHPLLCFKFCFTLFLLALFYQKHTKISFLIVVTLLLLVHYVVP